MSEINAEVADMSALLGVRSAPTSRRILAFAADLGVLLGVTLAAGGLGSLLARPLVAVLIGGAAGLVVLLVQLVVEGIRGRTVGKSMAGLRLLDAESLAVPGTGNVMLRAAVVWGPGVLLPVLGAVPFLASRFADPTRRGRGWHDRAAGVWLVDTRDGLDPLDREALRAARRALTRPHVRAHLALPSLATGVAPPDPALASVARSRAAVVSLPATVPGLPGGGDPAADTRTRRVDSPRAAQPSGEPAGNPGDESQGWVLVLEDGTRHSLTGRTLLGRAPTPGATGAEHTVLTLADPAMEMSRTHLEVVVEGDGLSITDLGSANGTGLVSSSGERSELPQGVRVSVDPGQRVRIGERLLRFERAGGR